MHYFRVHPDYWMDRLRKMRACGLNTVETYVPWNLHEEYPGKFDFSGFLDVRKFIQQAQEAGLYVIFRPGPYICAEWDLGGLPSWLLRDPNMKVRTNYGPYQQAVQRFFNELLPKVADLQALRGGPIIAVQVENEFGSYSDEIDHLLFIKEVKILIAYALPTVNFPNMEDGRKLFDMVRQWSKEFPLMVMEFWPGWFDHWGQAHKGLSIPLFEECLTGILEAGASFNMYMFHGGTNFGFMAGANYFEGSHYKPDVTSYGEINVASFLPFNAILSCVDDKVFLNGNEIQVMDWFSSERSIQLNCTKEVNSLDILVENHGRVNYVECGSNRFNEEKKGLYGEVNVDGVKVCNWRITPLVFKEDFIKNSSACNGWLGRQSDKKEPILARCVLEITGEPNDSFLQLPEWEKGIVLLNGFNLGRYWKIGPTQTLYVPAPLLRKGTNEILIFEQHCIGTKVLFRDEPILGETVKTLSDDDEVCYPKE
ncbi:hypothetical protein FSP39_019072 [Pinctada imbricata]|uniref:Beta-galactosidase n=1 Tax=Pinctada imbricata TaxID=66713 RepID=A0AA88YKM9_PINIB|nr:hypothetical protein FSP39_019072 [Pinctada imbricata]